MVRDLSKYPPTVRRILQDEDTIIGFFAIWAIGLIIFPTGGFYLGTIVSPAGNANGINHYWDLRVPDIQIYGGWGALIGLALGICLGIWATIRYPALKERENRYDAERDEHLHELSQHGEISTLPGQAAEHDVTRQSDI